MSVIPAPVPNTHQDYTSEEGKSQVLANIAKTQAETAKIQADETRAQEKHTIELDALRIALDRGKLTKEVDQIVRDRNRREEDMILACDWNHHVYNFSDVVEPESVLQCMTQLNQWVRQNAATYGNSKPLTIEIVFDSPGGAVFDGMHLFDYVRWVRSQGHSITTVALGNAASMAGILLQAGTTRVIGAESMLVIHRPSETRFFDSASSDDMKDRHERLQKIEKRMLNIFATRAAEALYQRNQTTSYDDLYASTTALIEKEWTKKDWWLDSDECLAYGLVDAIR